MIYLDCTSTNTVCADLLTGIQRVVRNILQHVPTTCPSGTAVQPVVATAAGFFPLFEPGFLPDSGAIHFVPGDTLLLLDAGWDLLPFWHHLEAAGQAGTRLVFVSYDLIPLTHPDYCDPAHVALFERYITKAVALADGFIGISCSSRDEICTYVHHQQPNHSARIKFDHFYLGADFDPPAVQRLPVRREIREFFAAGEPIYLLVSTIEPRKGHARLLTAVEHLWKQGQQIRLCFIGRVGWCVDDFMTYVQQHPQREKRLAVWHDANDAELAYTYQHARALVFPSVAEGFGLPLVEALQHGLPVIASDIPAHRETGRDLVRYIPPLDTDGLVAVLEQFSGAEAPAAFRPPDSYRWLSWHQSSKMLLNSDILFAK